MDRERCTSREFETRLLFSDKGIRQRSSASCTPCAAATYSSSVCTCIRTSPRSDRKNQCTSQSKAQFQPSIAAAPGSKAARWEICKGPQYVCQTKYITMYVFRENKNIRAKTRGVSALSRESPLVCKPVLRRNAFCHASGRSLM